MLNFLDFVLLIVLAILLTIALFLSTGIIYNQDGYVSVIEKKKQFFKIETNRLTYAFPILYRKVGYYPIKPREYKINGERVLIQVNDVMLLYKNKINLKKLIKQNKNLEETFKTYQITLIKK
ncbi:MAG: hypothetical protein MJ208_01370 [Bacilli bacterium]|nr:hypothetical protein [Bacilli bacterium]